MTLAVILSGAAGLIFQIVWLYECGLAFGNSLWAATIVLSSFMGGLALGNALVARFDRPQTRSLRFYAVLEFVVGMSGLALTYALPLVSRVLGPLTAAIGTDLWLVNLVRLGAAFAILVVPATAMGATLPVAVGAICPDPERFGRVLGHLYGWNTLGAVGGVVCAELLLVRYAGVKGAAWTAATLDFAAAAIAVRLGVRAPAPAGRTPARRAPADKKEPPPSTTWPLLGAAFLAGGALVALEVVWFRFLTMYVLSTTLAASLMLATVLAGIGLGGLAASLWLRRRPGAAVHAAIVALVAGCLTVWAYAAFGWSTSGTQIAAWPHVLWLAAALTAPTSLLSGMLFTLLGDAIERAMAVEACDVQSRATAWLTLANTAGAMCGPPFAAFVLLPAVGMEGAFFALALVYLAVAALAIGIGLRGVLVRPRRALIAAGVVFALTFVRFPFGSMRDRYFVRSAHAYAGDGSTMVAVREGASNTVFLMRQAWLGKPVYDRLITDGFSMSGTAVQGMRYMRAFAYWPMLLHLAPLKRALVVCYGVGVTAQAVDDIASLDSIDVVEISRDVVAMSDVIYAGRRPPLDDPRVRLHIEDGRHFLQTTADRYDLITGEPPPPRTPGAVNIYTREYFQLLYDRLAEGGIATYWVPVARPDPGTDVDTIIRAFCDVFDDCSLWNATPFDFMLVGTRHAQGPLSEEQFARPWVTPGLEARLREIGFEQPEEIGATFLGDRSYLRELTNVTPPLVDDYPQRLVPAPSRPSLSDPGYGSDRAVAEHYQSVIDPERARRRFLSSAFIRRLWPERLVPRTEQAFAYQRIVNRVFWEGGKPMRQIEDLHFLLTKTSLRTLPLWCLGSDEAKQRIAETAADAPGATAYARALRAFTGRGYRAASDYLAEAERLGVGGPTVRALHAYALCLAGDLEGARSLARGIQPADADESHFWDWMGSTFQVTR